jgi:prevent-host-death family protein
VWYNDSIGVINMQIALSELKLHIDRYVDLAQTSEVIITKYGKPAVKLVRADYEPWFTKEIPENVSSISELFGTLPPDTDLENAKDERLGL